MPKSKWSALVTLLVVFLSGALVGIFAGPLVFRTTQARRPSPEEIKSMRVKELHDALKLDDSQTTQVGQAYDDSRKEFFESRRENMKRINDNLHNKIRSVLKSDQLPAYEDLLRKWDAERKQHEQTKGPPPSR